MSGNPINESNKLQREQLIKEKVGENTANSNDNDNDNDNNNNNNLKKTNDELELRMQKMINDKIKDQQKGFKKGQMASMKRQNLLSKLSEDMKKNKDNGLFLIGLNFAEVAGFLEKDIEHREVKDISKLTVKQRLEYKRKKKEYTEAKQLLGEYVDINREELMVEKGYNRLSDMKDRKLNIEEYIDTESSFNEILRESGKYSINQRPNTVSMKNLLRMTKILWKYRKTDIQWLHVASLIEVMYIYLKIDDETRTEFFSSDYPIDYYRLKNIEEFWKTEQLFMTNIEISRMKKDLNFYKGKKINEVRRKKTNKRVKMSVNQKPAVPVVLKNKKKTVKKQPLPPLPPTDTNNSF
jgi:hypothetical protein